jgi:amino acid permease
MNFYFIVTVGIFSFAFVCQQSNFFIFKGLKDRSIEAWKKTAGISIGISYILTFVFGVGGYLIFLDNSFGNVLNNFNFTGKQFFFISIRCFSCFNVSLVYYNIDRSMDILFYDSFLLDIAEPIICARLLLAITMIFTLPMECYVGRHAVVSVILRLISEFNKWNSKEGDNTRQSHMPSTKEEGRDTWLYTSLRVFITVIIWGSTMAVGIVVLDLGIVLALTGINILRY